MTMLPRPGLILLLPLTLLPLAAFSQDAAIPAPSPLYSGFQIPTVEGTLRYSISGSERFTIGSVGDESGASTNLSGNFGFISPSKNHPLTITYTGGYLQNTSGQPSSFFHQLSIGQVLTYERWTFDANQSLHYLPNTPATGLSGIAGLGDLGSSSGTTTTQQTLTPYATRIDEAVNATVIRKITGSTGVTVTGVFSTLRFLNDSQGIESNTIVGQGGLNHRIDALSQIAVTYRYVDFSYLNTVKAFNVNGGTLQYRRKVTRKLDVSLQAGPQRIGGLAAPRYTYSADVHLTYQGSEQSGFSTSLSYQRTTNSGNGIAFGAITDTASATVGRRLSRSFGVTGQFNVGRNDGLQQITSLPLSSTTLAAGLQVNDALTRTVSIFSSYSAQQQSYSGTAQGISPANGISQTLGFGVTYSPSPRHLGRQ